jgi:hypothetical protein
MNMKCTLFLTLTLALLTAIGCTQAQRNPDAILRRYGRVTHLYLAEVTQARNIIGSGRDI